MASEFVTSRRTELERTAGKYTDKPAECVAALRGDIITDIAEGLALIGVTGGLIDILEYAADLAYAELPETTETDLSRKRGIMTDSEPAGVRFKTVTYDPCAPHPAYLNEHHATAVVGHATEWLLTEQMKACPNQADTMEFAAIGDAEHGPDAAAIDTFARSLLGVMGYAWSNLTTKHYMRTDPTKDVVRGALVVPYWAAAMPFIGERAVQHRIPLLAAMWHGFEFTAPPPTPSGVVLAVVSKNHMAPSLALQNYTVESVHPFTTAAGAA
jgi:hypothetical protein